MTCRKERTRCACDTFKATEDQLRALAPGAALKLEINARRTKYESVDVSVSGLYDVGSGQDDPATLASVSINDDDMGPARGTKDVEAADATLSTSCSLRGWAQLPPYAFRWRRDDARPVGDGARVDTSRAFCGCRRRMLARERRRSHDSSTHFWFCEGPG